jgi:alkylation response protein AidB-like acyl-CoA dehydrogenase
MRLELSPEHRALRGSVREFAEAVVKPAAAEIDSGHRFPTEIIAQAAELDLMGMLIPAEYGGAGLDHLGLPSA